MYKKKIRVFNFFRTFGKRRKVKKMFKMKAKNGKFEYFFEFSFFFGKLSKILKNKSEHPIIPMKKISVFILETVYKKLNNVGIT